MRLLRTSQLDDRARQGEAERLRHALGDQNGRQSPQGLDMVQGGQGVRAADERRGQCQAEEPTLTRGQARNSG